MFSHGSPSRSDEAQVTVEVDAHLSHERPRPVRRPCAIDSITSSVSRQAHVGRRRPTARRRARRSARRRRRRTRPRYETCRASRGRTRTSGTRRRARARRRSRSPLSSNSSRRAASSGSSPGSAAPPGRYHWPVERGTRRALQQQDLAVALGVDDRATTRSTRARTRRKRRPARRRLTGRKLTAARKSGAPAPRPTRMLSTMATVDLVVTDLDGTLWFGHEETHPTTVAAWRELERRGIPVLVATGRRVDLDARAARPSRVRAAGGDDERRARDRSRAPTSGSTRHQYTVEDADEDPRRVPRRRPRAVRLRRPSSRRRVRRRTTVDASRSPRRPRLRRPSEPTSRDRGTVPVLMFGIMGHVAGAARTRSRARSAGAAEAHLAGSDQYGGHSCTATPIGLSKWTGVRRVLRARRSRSDARARHRRRTERPSSSSTRRRDRGRARRRASRRRAARRRSRRRLTPRRRLGRDPRLRLSRRSPRHASTTTPSQAAQRATGPTPPRRRGPIGRDAAPDPVRPSSSDVGLRQVQRRPRTVAPRRHAHTPSGAPSVA